MLWFLQHWVRLSPNRWRPRLLWAAGRYLSPYSNQQDKVCKAIADAMPEVDTRVAWRYWLDSHCRFVLDFLGYAASDRQWLNAEVHINNAAALAKLNQSGGLVLTYHTRHQNTLCCVLGRHGIKVSAVAALPDESPLFPYLGYWMQRVNTDSEAHFLGGAYIFTNNLRQLLRKSRQALQERQALVNLCDFQQAGPSSAPVARFLNRVVSPPTGSIEIARDVQAPVFVAMLTPDNGRLCLDIEELDATLSLDEIVQRYFSFLESHLRNTPGCWEGWDWFDSLPRAEREHHA